METAQCLVDRAVKLDAVDTTSVDGRGADLDNIDVERILERACYGARRRLPLYQAPEFTKRLKTLVNARTGEKAHFECIWSAFPRPAVKWYHDDEEINTDDVRFEIESLRRGVLKLTLKSVTKADEGSYKCKAENQEGVTSTTGYLTVTGDSRKSRSRESRRKRQRAVSLPPHLRTITEQSSLEEREEVACSRQPRSPIQDFIDNIEAFRKDRTWPLLSRHHGNDSKRLSTAQHWEDDGGSGTAETGAAGGKLSFERVLDNCENPFARRPLLPYSDDRVTSEGDVTPNGCDVSPPSRPTSLHLAAGKNAADLRGRLPGRIAFPHAKTSKPVVVDDLKNDAGERTMPLVMRKPATAATRKTSPSRNYDSKQRDRVSPVPTKEKVYARVSGILRNHQPIDSSETSVTGLADAIADRGRRTHAAYPPELVKRTGSPVRQADSSESPVRRSVNSSERRSANSPERRPASHKRRSANSSESPVRQPVFSIESPVGGPVISSESPAGGPVISNESPVHGPVISGESPAGGPIISNESPMHGAVISNESPMHGAVISSESPARGSVISSESPMHGAVISNESPMHGAVISNESPMHGAVISSESPARGSVISNKSPLRPPVIATKTVRVVQGPAKPAVPGPAKPAVPGLAKPAMPGLAKPAMPGPAKPARPGPAKPAVPGPAKPAVPGPAKPAMPAAAAKVSPRTCTTVVTPMAPYKGDPQRPVWLYFLLFVTCCACVGCALQAYPANFIFVVTALSVISFRLLLHRADFLGKS